MILFSPYYHIMNSDLKIVFAGPSRAGKTEFADIIAAVSKGFKGNCKPTVCLRILEFTTTIDSSGLQATISAQLWDSSGDEKYSAAWPAIAHEADGLVLMYNALDKNQGREIENYAKVFAKDLDSNQVAVVAHKIGESDAKPVRPKLPKSLEHVQIVIANAQDNLEDFMEQFSAFLGRVQHAKMEKIEQKERELVGA